MKFQFQCQHGFGKDPTTPKLMEAEVEFWEVFGKPEPRQPKALGARQKNETHMSIQR